MLVVVERPQYGVGNAAYANLECGAVGDVLGYMVADGNLVGGGLRCGNLYQRVVDGHGGSQPRDVYHRVAVAEGHVGVYLRNHCLGTLYRRGGEVGRYTEAYIAVGIRHRAVYKRDIHRTYALAEKGRHLAEKPGDDAPVAFAYPAPHGVGNEETVHQERFPELRAAVGSFAFGDCESHIDRDIAKFAAAPRHGGDKGFRDGGAALYKHMIAAFDKGGGGIGAHIFRLVHRRMLLVVVRGFRNLCRRRASTRIYAVREACCRCREGKWKLRRGA